MTTLAHLHTTRAHIKIEIDLYITFCLVLSENWNRYQQSAKSSKDSQNCFSCKSEPIVSGDMDVELGHHFGFPALHVMLGVVNKLCDELQKV